MREMKTVETFPWSNKEAPNNRQKTSGPARSWSAMTYIEMVLFLPL
jgi:hypothetical protein